MDDRDNMVRMNLRQRRATELTAAVLSKIDPYLDPEQYAVRRDTHDALMELFMTAGVDILTDHTRAECGLPQRTADGWTPDEIIALERHRMALLTRPLIFSTRGPLDE